MRLRKKLVIFGIVVTLVVSGGSVIRVSNSGAADTPLPTMRICVQSLFPPPSSSEFGFITPVGELSLSGLGCLLAFPIPIQPSYSVTEIVPAGWVLLSATCGLFSGGTTGTLVGATVTGIQVDPGDSVACTFLNSPAPTAKDQCDNGGWQSFGISPDQSIFKNQGDCVSFVATRGGNRPAI